jgi:hypothetical protein
MTPDSARNIDFVSNHELDGHGDCVQVMVHNGHAYIGHMFSDGFTVVDVRDPKHPQTKGFIAAPPNTRAFHLQTHGDLLLTVNAPNIWVMQGYSDPNDYFKASITDTFTKREKTLPPASGCSTSQSQRNRVRSASCRSMGWASTGSGMSAGVTPMARATGRVSPTMCWRSSTCKTRPDPR